MHSAGQIATPTDRAGLAPARGGHVRAFVHDDIDPSLAADWVALAGDASEANAFAEHWFVAASLAAFDAERRVRFVEVRRGNTLIGVLPVAEERGYARMPLRFLQGWWHNQMFLCTPLVLAGEETAFWTAALELLDCADWAPGFLHLRGVVENGPVHRGLLAVRHASIVHRRTRALLASDLHPEAYYEQAVRAKKRKEIRRLQNRLAELGEVRARTLADGADLPDWTHAFLALEKAGWKGKEGTALACVPETESFFFNVLADAWEAGRLQFLRLDLDGRPIAMLVNFLTAPGAFSFKTTFDEDYARFSPGVLIQIENLNILNRADIAWMDSCAMDNHPMIDSFWTERREIVRLTVRLGGARRTAFYCAARAAETGWAALRRLLGTRT
jgi:CelD/BcsL family acetyltransferase involved in cellulose biosynthesis